jgi:hypothetical protein
MDFIDQVRQLGTRAAKLKDSIQTEEATKMSLVIPFFQALGYDVFNPDEFMPEFVADVGIKKGEKVDYAVLKDGLPAILIECKWCNSPLEKHDSQLFRYFGTTTAKFAILTNGILYKFFTDLDEANKMDLTPFLEIDLMNLKENLVPEVKKFHKDKFDPESLLSTASELKYSKAVKDYFGEQLAEPSKEFIAFFVRNVYDGMKTQAVLDRFSGIVHNALNDFINERMSEKITAALGGNKTNATVQQQQPAESQPEPAAPSSKKINTTAEELECYYAIKSMLIDVVPLERVQYTDYVSYFVVGIDVKDKPSRWLCRLKMDGRKKYVEFQAIGDASFEKVSIEGVNDLYIHKDRFKDIANSLL